MQGQSVGELYYDLTINDKALKSGLDSADNAVKSLGQKMSDHWDKSVAASQKFALGVGVAGAAIVGFGVLSLKAFSQQEDAIAGLNAGLKNTGENVAVVTKELQAQASALQKVTKFSDEQILSADAMLTTFKLSGASISKLNPALLDMAEGLRDVNGNTLGLDEGAKLMGKAMGNAEGGVDGLATALRRNGVIMTEAQKAIFSTGNEAQRTATLVQIMGDNFGGRALAAGQTFSGKMTILKNQFNEVQEAIGGTIAKAISPFIESLTKWIDKAGGAEGIMKKLTEVFKKIQPFIPAIAGAILGALIPSIVALGITIGAALWELAPFMALGAAIVALQVKFNILGKAAEVLKSIFHALHPVLKIIADIFKDIFTQLVRLGEMIGKMLAPVFEFLGRHIEGVKKILLVLLAVAFLPVIAGIALLIAGLKILSIALKFIADHFEGIKKIVVVTLAIAFAPLILTIGAIIALVKNWGTIMNFFKDVFTTVSNAIVAAWQFVYNVVTTVMQAIWNFISPILNFLKDLFVIVFGGIALVIIMAMQTIWNIIVSIWQAIWGFLQPIIEAIGNFLATRWENLKNNTMMVFNWIKDFIVGVWQYVYDVVSGIVQRLIDFFAPAFNWLYEKGKAIVNGLVAGIKAVAGAVWNGIKEVADQIGNFFSGAGHWLYDVGRAIISGLVDGMKSAIRWVTDAAGNVADAVKNKLKSVLGIHSPSTVFEGYGVNINQGLVVGLKKSQKDVENALITPSMNMRAGVNGSPFSRVLANSASLTGNNSANTVNHGDTIVNIGTIQDRQDADYILNRLNRNSKLESMGVSPT